MVKKVGGDFFFFGLDNFSESLVKHSFRPQEAEGRAVGLHGFLAESYLTNILSNTWLML